VLLACREEYLAKIDKRIKTYDFKLLNEPRTDKLLLVLDIDYTLFGEFFSGYTHIFSATVWDFNTKFYSFIY